jgi:hypothetical protein
MTLNVECFSPPDLYKPSGTRHANAIEVLILKEVDADADAVRSAASSRLGLGRVHTGPLPALWKMRFSRILVAAAMPG